MSEKLWYLKRCDLFARLLPDQLAELETRCKVRSFPRRSTVYLPADSSESVFVLVSGRVKICHLTPDGKQSILAFIEPGELFGELALLESGQRDEYAETIDASKVVMIPGEALEQLIAQHPRLSLGVTKVMGLRRRRIEQRLKNLLFLSNRERLTHLLLELIEQYGRPAPEGVELVIKLSHQDLANVIGSTRETVTVVLGELQSEGLIRVGRRRLTICDAAQLAKTVHRDPPVLPDPLGKPASVY